MAGKQSKSVPTVQTSKSWKVPLIGGVITKNTTKKK